MARDAISVGQSRSARGGWEEVRFTFDTSVRIRGVGDV